MSLNAYLYDVDIFMHILETRRFDLMIESKVRTVY